MNKEEILKFEENVIQFSYLLYLNNVVGQHNALPDNNENEELNQAMQELKCNNSNELLEISEKQIIKYNLKKYICPALNSISGDIQEIAKIILGVLLPLSLTNQTTMPLNPLIYSGIAIVIFRSGISTFCTDY